MDRWPFADPENQATLTVRQVVRGGAPILLVSHDADDGMWQFLSGNDVETEDAMVVSLRSVFRIDPTIGEVADLPLGWRASRRAIGGPWIREAVDSL